MRSAAAPPYGLGHTEQELDRLVSQAAYFGDLTEHVFNLAGLEAGMRVLDAGCGPGDVSFLAARTVGPAGAVIGVDSAAAAVDAARGRAAGAGLDNVHFVHADLADLSLDLPVDAVVGRLVLMYLSDPVAVLARLRTLLNPGGLLIFQEMDLTGAVSHPRCPLYDQTLGRVRETLRRIGADVRIGLALPQLFRAAGLPTPRMIMGARVASGPDPAAIAQVVGITRTLLEPMRLTGVATPDEVDIDTLAQRLRAQLEATGATIVSPHFIGAWTRLPGGRAAA